MDGTKYLFVLIILGFGFSLSAQSFKSKKKEALALVEAHNYIDALPILEDIFKAKPKDTELAFALAKTYQQTNNLGESMQIVSQLLDKKSKNRAELYLTQASNKHRLQKFADAILLYKKCLGEGLKDEMQTAFIKDQIMRCAQGLRFAKNIGKDLVDNLGENVNTNYDEFAPILSPNYSSKLYFATAGPNTNGGKRNNQGIRDDINGHYCSDIFASYLNNGTWSHTEPLSYMINGPRHEYVSSFSNKGKEMYIFRGFSLFSGEILVDTFKKNIDQMISPQYFDGPLMPEWGDKDLIFYHDSIILFSSQRKGGFGGFDLYISKKNGDNWTVPHNLGAEINSAYDEVTPFLSLDGSVLYFSSNSLNSIGGFDIFSAKFNEKSNNWIMPENLGIPINSADDDVYFKLNNEGFYGYFASTRPESLGQRDIFSVYFNKPKIFANKQNKVSNILSSDTSKIVTFQEKQKATIKEISGESTKYVPMLQVEIGPLYYDDPYNLLTEKNISLLNRVASLLVDNSILNLVLTCASATDENAKVEAYLDLKRAEQVRDYLFNKGVNPQQVLIRGIANNFPIIQQEANFKNKSLEKSLSNRVEFQFLHDKEAGIKFQYLQANISKNMQNEGFQKYKNANIGLVYRVQISAGSQVNNNTLLDEMKEFVVEKRPGNDLIYYMIGTETTLSKINEFKKSIQDKGVKDAFVVPYIDGYPISKNQAFQYIKQYPDLNNFVGTGK